MKKSTLTIIISAVISTSAYAATITTGISPITGDFSAPAVQTWANGVRSP